MDELGRSRVELCRKRRFSYKKCIATLEKDNLFSLSELTDTGLKENISAKDTSHMYILCLSYCKKDYCS